VLLRTDDGNPETIIMPEIRGSILAKALTARYPNLLTVYMSGYTDDALIKTDSLPENMTFLQKPFPPDLMLREIREVWERNKNFRKPDGAIACRIAFLWMNVSTTASSTM
jgi:DNA-binding NtrC family response regulator